MRSERRGAGVRQWVEQTCPDTERTLCLSTQFTHFTQRALSEPGLRFNALMGLLSDPQGLRESFDQQPGNKAPGVDAIRKAHKT